MMKFRPDKTESSTTSEKESAIEKRKEKISLSEVFNLFKSRLQQKLDPWLERIPFVKRKKKEKAKKERIKTAEAKYNQLERQYKESTKLGEEVRTYIQDLFMEGAYSAPVDETERRNFDKESYFERRFEAALSNVDTNENGWQEQALEFIEASWPVYNKLSTVTSAPLGKVETISFNYPAKGSNAGIRIEENLRRVIAKGKVEIVRSDLGLLVEKKGGSLAMIDLDTFLPLSCRSIPAADEVLYDSDFDIASYQSLSSEKSKMKVKGSYFVLYEKMAKKGGRLTYLHEAIHTWQIQLREMKQSPKYHFERFYNYCKVHASIIQAEKEWKATLDKTMKDQKQKEKYFQTLSKSFRELMWKKFYREDYGNEKEVQKLIGNKTDDLGDTIRLTVEGTGPCAGQRFLLDDVPKKPFDKLVNDYVDSESEAWYLAVKVLNFLRDKGIDLEPELQNIEDFKEVIYEQGLDTYQRRLELLVPEKEMHKLTKVFGRKKITRDIDKVMEKMRGSK